MDSPESSIHNYGVRLESTSILYTNSTITDRGWGLESPLFILLLHLTMGVNSMHSGSPCAPAINK